MYHTLLKVMASRGYGKAKPCGTVVRDHISPDNGNGNRRIDVRGMQ